MKGFPNVITFLNNFSIIFSYKLFLRLRPPSTLCAPLVFYLFIFYKEEAKLEDLDNNNNRSGIHGLH